MGAKGICKSMPKFFVKREHISEDSIIITGDDVKHISVVLRMSRGDKITVCDTAGMDYNCNIKDINKEKILLEIESSMQCPAEPSINVTLYQAMVKGDKSDVIIQKAVELGVNKIVFYISEFCISRPDKAGIQGKIKRWQSISESAAKQCGRGIIPEIGGVLSFSEALEKMSENNHMALLYEGECVVPLKNIITEKSFSDFAFMIGPEGGFSEKEVKLAAEKCIPLAGLGKRILRTETASGCVLSALMYETGNL